MESNGWSVAVFKCKSDYVEKVLVNFYEFIRDLRGVEDIHFLIRDRVDDDVVFSFRVCVKEEQKRAVKSKINYKLGTIVSKDRFAVDPDRGHPLQKYVAWSAKGGIEKHGREKFDIFCGLLSQLSNIVVNMAKKGYFSSAERVEMVHVISWMLGMTEYGLLTVKHMEVGYYDRITNQSIPYLRQTLGK